MPVCTGCWGYRKPSTCRSPHPMGDGFTLQPVHCYPRFSFPRTTSRVHHVVVHRIIMSTLFVIIVWLCSFGAVVVHKQPHCFCFATVACEPMFCILCRGSLDSLHCYCEETLSSSSEGNDVCHDAPPLRRLA